MPAAVKIKRDRPSDRMAETREYDTIEYHRQLTVLRSLTMARKNCFRVRPRGKSDRLDRLIRHKLEALAQFKASPREEEEARDLELLSGMLEPLSGFDDHPWHPQLRALIQRKVTSLMPDSRASPAPLEGPTMSVQPVPRDRTGVTVNEENSRL
ncbi:MAG: hypothetical protein Q9190_005953 [Brigantiaea leucoxantha]